MFRSSVRIADGYVRTRCLRTRGFASLPWNMRYCAPLICANAWQRIPTMAKSIIERGA